MANLPLKLSWEQAQTRWKSQLDTILANPILSGNQIDNIVLLATTPQPVNHLLARMPQGWFLVDNNADSVVWRTLPFNTSTITLESSVNTTISIWIY